MAERALTERHAAERIPQGCLPDVALVGVFPGEGVVGTAAAMAAPVANVAADGSVGAGAAAAAG